MSDASDIGGVQQIVSDYDAKERKPRTKIGQNFQPSVLYILFNCPLVTGLVTTSITRLILADSYDERTMWYSVLTWCAGYVIPQPRP